MNTVAPARCPRYEGLAPASRSASHALSRVRAKNTRCELALQLSLRRRRIRFSTHTSRLPGRPDLVFSKQRLVVFCDGDFWHGRSWRSRRKRLQAGHNAEYWTTKIATNMRRDRRINRSLQQLGWTVLRVWESAIRHDSDAIADAISVKLKRQEMICLRLVREK